MATYSFLDVVATITGPGGIIPIGTGSGVAEEGITIEFEEDKNMMHTGADGSVMHSLRANKKATATIRLLKTSPTNALLSALYNFQSQSSANWGTNLIIVSDVARGDIFSCISSAFKKHAQGVWPKDAPMIEWRFDVGQLEPLFGLGVPDVNV